MESRLSRMGTTDPSQIAGTPQDVTDAGSAPHDPALYDFGSLAESFPSLPSFTSSCAKELTSTYKRDGFVAIEKAIPSSQVENLRSAVDRLTQGENKAFCADVKQLAASGETPDFSEGTRIPWAQYEAGTNVTARDSGSAATTPVLSPSIAPRVRKLMGFVGYEPEIDSFLQGNNLVQLVADLLECDDVSEMELFQDMAMLKPASGGREKPWHQDKAYFDVALETKVVGCWLALDEATPENGCMRFQKGGHKAGARPHFNSRDYQICDADAPPKEQVVAAPLKAGGMVLFDGLIPHGTPTNTTNSRRRALQFHWIKKGAVRIPEDAPGGRTQVFGGARQGLTC